MESERGEKVKLCDLRGNVHVYTGVFPVSGYEAANKCLSNDDLIHFYQLESTAEG